MFLQKYLNITICDKKIRAIRPPKPCGPSPFGPKGDESPVKGLVAPVRLDLEANLLHHKNALFALVSSESS